MRPARTSLKLDGRTYSLDVVRRVRQPPEAPRLVAVSLLHTESAWQVLDTMVRSIQAMTPEPHELWVVDNNSPRPFADRLRGLEGVNVILSRTEPLPPEQRGLLRGLRGRGDQRLAGSYANAAGLEIALRFIEPDARLLMSLHMDVMACRPDWLAHLRAKIDAGAAAAGMIWERGRVSEGVLHVLGCLVDYQLFRRLGLTYWPSLPALDVGDAVSVELRRHGHALHGCRCTYGEPSLAEGLPPDSPFRSIQVARSLDDEGNVIFMHLGRGIRKSTGDYEGASSSAETWVRFAEEHILPGAPR